MSESGEPRVGILGVGAYLPPEVRTNDWWPQELVAKWKKRTALLPEDEAAPESEGERMCIEAVREASRDPFWGARQRHIADLDVPPSDLEYEAAKSALQASGVDPEQIDLLITYSTIPDYLICPNATVVHRKLGLRPNVITSTMDVVCNTALQQLFFAEQCIRTGQARYALLVQSTVNHRLLDSSWASSPWFGEGATAMVVGPVGESRGILSWAHRVDGRFHEAVVATVRGGKWYDGGRITWHPKDTTYSREMIVKIADFAKDALGEALERAGVQPGEVRFLATHQPNAWTSDVIRRYLGFDLAKTVTTYPWAGNLTAANVPLVLHTALGDDLIQPGDVVAAFTGGSGITMTACVMRWA